MAKSYYAVNQIRHGNGGEVQVFEAGDKVVGLPKEVMVSLWESGVLREVDPDAPTTDPRDARIVALEAEIEALKSAKEAGPEPTPPTQAVTTPESPTANSAEAAMVLEGTMASPTSEAPTGEQPPAE